MAGPVGLEGGRMDGSGWSGFGGRGDPDPGAVDVVKVAVVCATERDAIDLVARLGMTQSALPLAAGQSALLGHRFTAVVIRSQKRVKDTDWWETLLGRTTGPIYTLDEWGTRRPPPGE